MACSEPGWPEEGGDGPPLADGEDRKGWQMRKLQGVDDDLVAASIWQACHAKARSVARLVTCFGLWVIAIGAASVVVDLAVWHDWRKYFAFGGANLASVAFAGAWRHRAACRVLPGVLVEMGRCERCGYKLTAQERRCPECGTPSAVPRTSEPAKPSGHA